MVSSESCFEFINYWITFDNNSICDVNIVGWRQTVWEKGKFEHFSKCRGLNQGPYDSELMLLYHWHHSWRFSCNHSVVKFTLDSPLIFSPNKVEFSLNIAFCTSSFLTSFWNLQLRQKRTVGYELMLLSSPSDKRAGTKFDSFLLLHQ